MKPEPLDLPELTLEEQEIILLEARKQLAQKLRAKEYAEKLRKPIPMPTAEQFGDWILAESKREDENNPRYLGPDGFVIDETNKRVFDLLVLYSVKDERFLLGNPKYSFDKSIALFGPVGCGKTTLMRLFTSNPTESYTITPCTTTTDNYHLHGDEYFSYYCQNSELYGNPFNHTRGGRCFDDLGVEPIPTWYYKQSRNMMQDIFSRRYDLRDQCGKTHFTTNLSWDQIETSYGQRVRSRLREISNAIFFDPKTPDRR